MLVYGSTNVLSGKWKYEKNSQDIISRTVSAITDNRKYAESPMSYESTVRIIGIIFVIICTIAMIIAIVMININIGYAQISSVLTIMFNEIVLICMFICLISWMLKVNKKIDLAKIIHV